jgi:yopX protein|nr:MAG TPA: YopX protein [Caudoviricetes sp.]
MNNVEFRVWSKLENKMYGVYRLDSVYISIIENNQFKQLPNDVEYVDLMQYTDCTDSKGKMIFEGDILLSSNENGTFLQLIGFGDSEREYDSILKGFKIINGYTLENDDYEIIECKPLTQELVKKYDIPVIEKENIIMDGWWVIGNKWENPELMKLMEGKDDKKG